MFVTCCKAERNPFPSKIFTNSIIRWPVVLKEQLANNYTFLILPLFFEQHSVNSRNETKKGGHNPCGFGSIGQRPMLFFIDFWLRAMRRYVVFLFFFLIFNFFRFGQLQATSGTKTLSCWYFTRNVEDVENEEVGETFWSSTNLTKV